MITKNSTGSNISNAMQTKIQGNARTFKARLLKGNTVVSCDILSISVSKGAGENFASGSIFIPYMEAKIANCSTTLKGQDITLQIGMTINNSDEWIVIGTYTVTELTNAQGVIDLVAVGFLNSKCSDLVTINDNTSISTAISNITPTGVTVNGQGITLSGTITDGFTATRRDAFGEIANLLGGFVTEGNNKNIVIAKPMSGTSVSVSDAKCVDAPFFEEADVTDNGYTFRPGTMDMVLGDPRLEAWDKLSVTIGSNTYTLPCMRLVHTFDGGLQTAVDATIPKTTAIKGSTERSIERLSAEVNATSQIASGLATSVIEINQDIEGLQTQIDGNIITWVYDYVPTTSNAPASSWTTTDEKDNHLGDLFYNTATGSAYRYKKSGSTYSWEVITDAKVTDALTQASAAGTLAGNKKRIFITQPTPPYDEGDLWVQGSTGDIKVCTKSGGRQSGSYTASDWALASKYTDDTVANEAKGLAQAAQTTANGKNTVYYDDRQPTGGTYKIGDTWFDTDDDNKIYRYTGTQWSAVTLGDDALASLSASKLTAGTIDASQITVSNLDAGNITSGTLSTQRLQISGSSGIITVGGLATTSDLPTDLGDLTNNAGYATTTDVSNAEGRAETKATNYLSVISGTTGISVHDANDTSNYVNIASNMIRLVTGGVERFKAWVESNVAKIRVGAENEGHVEIQSSGMDIYGGSNGQTRYASFGATSTIGTDSTGVTISADELTLKKNGVSRFKVTSETAGYRDITGKATTPSAILVDTNLLKIKVPYDNWTPYACEAYDDTDSVLIGNVPKTADRTNEPFSYSYDNKVAYIWVYTNATMWTGKEITFTMSVYVPYVTAGAEIGYYPDTLSDGSVLKIGIGEYGEGKTALKVLYNGDTRIKGDAYIGCNDDGTGGTEVTYGVKGNAESSYRTGQVNLTPANIGAAPAPSFSGMGSEKGKCAIGDLQLVWGTGTGTAGTTSSTSGGLTTYANSLDVSFGVTFKYDPVVMADWTGNYANQVSIAVTGTSTTGCTIVGRITTTTSRGMRWLAIGQKA